MMLFAASAPLGVPLLEEQASAVVVTLPNMSTEQNTLELDALRVALADAKAKVEQLERQLADAEV